MPGGWFSRLPRPLAVGISALAISLLVAQSAALTPTRPSTQEHPPVTAAQPASEPAATQPATAAASELTAETQPADTGEQASRERFVSGLLGSKHDFTRGGRSGRDLCLPCHTPHLVASPLPRLDRRPMGTQPLRPYQGMGVELTGWSLLCLGCHDGVTAPDVYSSAHAVSVVGQLANSQLGSRGLRSHPVGIRYPANDEHYNPLAAVEAAGLILPDGRIQCTTCHDAHNTHRHTKLLRLSDERSRLCLTCHRL
jgi:predicted CXXCH cytochrome family protein